MREVTYRGRRAVQLENALIRVTVMVEGAHIAEILHKATSVNPLWTPPWESIEPSAYEASKYPEYGGGLEAQLLSGILGHNICLDTFGTPSAEELAAGIPVHGEASVIAYDVSPAEDGVTLSATLSKAQLRFARTISVADGSFVVRFHEEVENLTAFDRPIGWTQHVTVGPPFLERGSTQFRASATQSKVIDSDFNEGAGTQLPGAEFDWPFCPRKDGGIDDLSIFPSANASGGFTAHLMDLREDHAWFTAWSPSSKVAIGYVWKRADFPWLARWEENHLRTQPPWNGQGLTCGMEFGVSPMVESRREMVERATLFGVPTFRWLAARETARADYCAFVRLSDVAPGGDLIEVEKLG